MAPPSRRRLFGQEQAVLYRATAQTAPVHARVVEWAGTATADGSTEDGDGKEEAQYKVHVNGGGGKHQVIGERSLAPELTKGEAVWYYTKAGKRLNAKVLAVDLSIWPPSYTVEEVESGAVKETEGSRLIPAAVGAYEEKRAAADAMMAALLEEEKPKAAKKKRGGGKSKAAKKQQKQQQQQEEEGEEEVAAGAAAGAEAAPNGMGGEDAKGEEELPAVSGSTTAAPAQPPLPPLESTAVKDAAVVAEEAVEGHATMPPIGNGACVDAAGRKCSSSDTAEADPFQSESDLPAVKRSVGAGFRTLKLFLFRIGMFGAVTTVVTYILYLSFCPHLQNDESQNVKAVTYDL